MKDKKKIIVIFIIIVLVIGIYGFFLINKMIESNLINKEVSQVDNYIFDQKMYMIEQNKKEINLENTKNPYIPEGFKYVEGDWNTGYVIEDQNLNQFVWVPITNNSELIESEKIPQLGKYNFSSSPFVSTLECYDKDYEDFAKSVTSNGGFYVSRFEIGKDENNNPVSKKDCEIYSNVNVAEASKIAKNMYNNINSRLINGMAYDTINKWINITNENVENVKRIAENVDIKTGVKSYNNIFDIFDDISELTSELTYCDYIVYRGIYNLDDFAQMDINSRSQKFDNRYIAKKDDKNNTFTFRTILYK